jgi:hypothetical protein
MEIFLVNAPHILPRKLCEEHSAIFGADVKMTRRVCVSKGLKALYCRKVLSAKPSLRTLLIGRTECSSEPDSFRWLAPPWVAVACARLAQAVSQRRAVDKIELLRPRLFGRLSCTLRTPVDPAFRSPSTFVSVSRGLSSGWLRSHTRARRPHISCFVQHRLALMTTLIGRPVPFTISLAC